MFSTLGVMFDVTRIYPKQKQKNLMQKQILRGCSVPGFKIKPSKRCLEWSICSLNNKTAVMKKNAYALDEFEFRLSVIISLVYKFFLPSLRMLLLWK
jgi:hypothetical protein